MSHPIRLAVLAAGLAVAAGCVPPPPPAPQLLRAPTPTTSAPRPPDDHTVTLGADVLVRAYGLSQAEALRQMRAQPAAVAAAVDLQTRLGLPDGAVWIDHRAGGKVVARSSSAGAASVASEVGAAHGVAVDVVAAARGTAAVAAADELAAALLADGVEGFSVHYDASSDVFAVEVPPAPAVPGDPAPEDVAAEAADDAGLAPDDVDVDEVAGIQTAACTADGRHCDPPLRGATVIRAPVSATAVVYCSGGFVGRTAADGLYVVVTAGHCATGAGAGRTWTAYQPATQAWTALGVPSSAVFGSEGDSSMIPLQDANGWSPAPTLVAGPSAVSPAAPLAQAYRIEAIQRPVVGAVLCASGASSGTSCGEVTGAGVTVSFGGSGGTTTLVEGLVRLDLRGRGLMCGGDSGGPLYANGLGFGLVSGGALTSTRTIDNGIYRATVPCGDTVMYLQDLPRAAARLGVLIGAGDWRTKLGWNG